MASFVRQKGHMFLLKSLIKLKSYDCNYKLTIVGEGVLEKEIKDFVVENSLSANVEFKKNIPYGTPEMVNEYYSADIYLQPSVTTSKNEKEGIPGALIEAMASGLPVISTYHAGIPFIVKDNETGLLVNEWDIEGLSNCILKLVSDSELRKRLGKSAQEFVLKELDCNNKAKELEDIYLSANHQYKRVLNVEV
jgi:colanic acid/amylovoran biosynthesis glycosyltransferase